MSVIGLNEAERGDVDLGRWGLSQRRTLDPAFFENIYRWSRNDGCRKLIPVFDYPQHLTSEYLVGVPSLMPLINSQPHQVAPVISFIRLPGLPEV